MVSSFFRCRGPAIVPADMPSLCGNRKARGSGRPGQPLDRRGDDLGQAFGGAQARSSAGIEPARIVELFVEHRFAGKPARGKAQDDEMPLDAALRVAHDRFAVAGERDRLDA